MLVVCRWATLPLALLAAAALLAVGKAQQPSVLQRTHTFRSYQANPVMQGLLPVYETTVKVLTSTYANDDIVSLAGDPLDCAPYAADGSTGCTLAETWRKPRRTPDTQYTQVTTTCAPFAMKFENGNLRLMISPQCIGGNLYTSFGGSRRRELLLTHGNKTNYAARAAAKWAKQNNAVLDPSAMGLFYDSSDTVRPAVSHLRALLLRRHFLLIPFPPLTHAQMNRMASRPTGLG